MCGVKILDIGKLIEKKGFEIIISTSVIMLLISGGIFYFYAWRAVDYAQNSGVEDIGINKNVLDEVLRDLDSRALDLEELQRAPIPVPDIFK
jgi:hypothetical protein